MKPKKIQSQSMLETALMEIRNEIIEPQHPYNTIANKTYFLTLETEVKQKTNNQNRLFHGLLQAFWESGMSSFLSYEDLRDYYKRIAGLIELKRTNPLKEETKNILYKAIKLLPITDQEKQRTYDLLKGKQEFCKSWAEVSKDKATFAIKHLLNDCVMSGAYITSEKVKSIVDDMEKEIEN
jgi:hypothetical protein